MKTVQFAALALTLLLAACGGGGTTTPPPTEQPPAETPVTPTPDPANPANPGEGITNYGEWAWSWQQDGGNEFYDEGRFSITAVQPDNTEVSVGYMQTCFDGTCYDAIDGGAIFGPNEEGKLQIILFRLNSANDAVITFQSVDEDGQLTEDSQGRLTFEGSGQNLDNVTNDPLNGQFKITKISDTPVLPPVEF